MGGALMVFGAFVCIAIGVVIGGTIEQNLRANDAKGPLDKGAAHRYRQAARILHDLIYLDDLSAKNVPVLPNALKLRIEAWLESHEKAIKEGK